MSQRLAQKSTIVTGAGSGIGRAIAKVFAAEGWGADFMRSAAIAFARHNVTINAVLPGNIMTGSLDAIGEDYLRRVEQAIPLSRSGFMSALRPGTFFSMAGCSVATRSPANSLRP